MPVEGVAPHEPGKEASPLPGQQDQTASDSEGKKAQHGQGQCQHEDKGNGDQGRQRGAVRGRAVHGDQAGPGAQVGYHGPIRPWARRDFLCNPVPRCRVHYASVKPHGNEVNASMGGEDASACGCNGRA